MAVFTNTCYTTVGIKHLSGFIQKNNLIIVGDCLKMTFFDNVQNIIDTVVDFMKSAVIDAAIYLEQCQFNLQF
jgi:hypothetical protein